MPKEIHGLPCRIQHYNIWFHEEIKQTNIKLQSLKAQPSTHHGYKSTEKPGTSGLMPVPATADLFSPYSGESWSGGAAMQLTNSEPREVHMSSEMVSSLQSVASGAASVRLVRAMN